MNALTTWDPLRELEDFSNRLSGFFQNRLGGFGNGGSDWLSRSEWTPRVDITEDEKEYVIKADLPDVAKEDVKVTVENNVLLIRGERKFEKEEKNKRYHRVERSYGTFLRSFRLPDDADGSKIRADFKSGVLKVTLPKSEKATPKQIEIQSAG